MAGWQKADVVCVRVCARIVVSSGSVVSLVVKLVVSVWVGRDVVCVRARIVGSSGSVVGEELVVGNSVSSS